MGLFQNRLRTARSAAAMQVIPPPWSETPVLLGGCSAGFCGADCPNCSKVYFDRGANNGSDRSSDVPGPILTPRSLSFNHDCASM